MGRWAGCALLLTFACTRENPWFSVPGAEDGTSVASTGADATTAVTGDPLPGSSSEPAGTTEGVDPGTSTPAESTSTTPPAETTSTTSPVDPGSESTSGESTSGDESTGASMGESMDTGEPGECMGPCGTPGCGACPTVPQIEFPGFTIDAHEVTNDDYAAFLAVPFGNMLQNAACVWNTDLTPKEWPFPDGGGTHPVVWIDWCDAYAYCKWAGKRLCGRIGGGPGGYDFMGGVANKDTNQWFRACSGTNGNKYPYGPNYSADACNGGESPYDAAIEVGSLPGCKGSAGGLYDMSGNVWELVDACEDEAPDAECLRRGGGFMSNSTDLRCDLQSHRGRQERFDHVGTRCCTDL